MKKIIFLLLFLLLSTAGNAQSGAIDLSLNPADSGFGKGDGMDNTVHCILEQPDGKILVGGTFTKYNNVPKAGLVRLNSDGSPDGDFNPALAFNPVYAIEIQPDGKLLIGCESGLKRLNPDGTNDASFASVDVIRVRAVKIQPDGKILIGGNFITCNNISRNHIARLNADGSVDTGFDPGTGLLLGYNSATGTTASKLVLLDDGKILVAGNFAAYNGVSRSSIARLNADGSLDMGFDPGTGMGFQFAEERNASAILVLPDGKIMLGGRFDSYNGTAIKSLARLNENGSLDTSFNTGSGFTYLDTSGVFELTLSGEIKAIARQADGKFLVAGDFDKFNGISAICFIRLNSDGSLDTSFNTGDKISTLTATPFDRPTIHSLSFDSSGRILMGGHYNTYNGNILGNMARVYPDGTADPGFNPVSGTDGEVTCSIYQPDGKIIVGGGFSNYNGVRSRGLVRMNDDGTIDTGFNVSFEKPVLGGLIKIETIALQYDGKILAGGNFTSCNGTEKKRIVRLNADGTLDPDFNTTVGNSEVIRKIIYQPDGKILLAVGHYVRRINHDGTIDNGFTSLYADINNTQLLQLQNNGSIVYYNNNQVKRVYGNGAIDYTFNIPQVAASSIALLPEGKMYIGGGFSNINGIGIAGMARLNVDGTIDYSFIPDPSYGAVTKMKIQPDGRVLIYSVNNSYKLSRVDPSGATDATFTFGATAGFNQITDINIQDNGYILIGGAFIAYNGVGRNRLVRLSNLFLDVQKAPDTMAAVKIYPNPASDILNIDTGNIKIKSVSIYNSLGQKVLAKADLPNAFDVGSLAAGAYFIKIESADGTAAKKFIKK